jgi:predicted alpha/beta superfamily hydrolase
MKAFPILIVIFLAAKIMIGQVTFIIDSLPAYTPPEDTLFIAGDFQGWNPGDPEFALQKNEENKWFITWNDVGAGINIQFKFTRGDWSRVEKGPNGEEIPNRTYTTVVGDTVYFIIYNWADFGGGGTSTAAENVEVMDEDFYMPQLDRNRRIWLYLPPDYYSSTDHYPVIYMHDGQNLFDAVTSFVGEWEVDETLNDLHDAGYEVPIVVGIDNGGNERINEYTPWQNPQYGGGLGDLYMEFIVETLKPFIDENYRTLPDRENTAIWGSSLGGLISYYGILKYQDIFGKAGIYSPSYWWSDSVWVLPAEVGYQQDMKVYQMTGSLEGGSMVQDTWTMHDTLLNFGVTEQNISTKIVEGGEHNEQLWREDYAEAYLWLFSVYASDISEQNISNSITIYPNPVKDNFYFYELPNEQLFNLVIYDLSGRELFHNKHDVKNAVDVSHLKPGVYMLVIESGGKVYRGKIVKQ